MSCTGDFAEMLVEILLVLPLCSGSNKCKRQVFCTAEWPNQGCQRIWQFPLHFCPPTFVSSGYAKLQHCPGQGLSGAVQPSPQSLLGAQHTRGRDIPRGAQDRQMAPGCWQGEVVLPLNSVAGKSWRHFTVRAWSCLCCLEQDLAARSHGMSTGSAGKCRRKGKVQIIVTSWSLNPELQRHWICPGGRWFPWSSGCLWRGQQCWPAPLCLLPFVRWPEITNTNSSSSPYISCEDLTGVETCFIKCFIKGKKCGLLVNRK